MVELLQVFRWDPILVVDRTSYLMDFIAAQKVAANLQARDIACVAISCVPVTRDLGRVFLIEHWIEDRLPKEPRGKSAILTFLNQRELVWPGWTKQDNRLIHFSLAVAHFSPRLSDRMPALCAIDLQTRQE